MPGKPPDATPADLVVLSFLSQKPMHGYALNQELIRCEVEDWAAISSPQVYYSLRKLVDRGWTRRSRKSDQSLGPSKDTYEVTAKGRDVLKEALARPDWATKRPPSPFQTWLALAHHTDKKVRRRMIEERREFLNAEIRKEQETLVAIEGDSGTKNCVAYVMVTLVIRQFEAERGSLKDLERVLLPAN